MWTALGTYLVLTRSLVTCWQLWAKTFLKPVVRQHRLVGGSVFTTLKLSVTKCGLLICAGLI